MYILLCVLVSTAIGLVSAVFYQQHAYIDRT